MNIFSISIKGAMKCLSITSVLICLTIGQTQSTFKEELNKTSNYILIKMTKNKSCIENKFAVTYIVFLFIFYTVFDAFKRASLFLIHSYIYFENKLTSFCQFWQKFCIYKEFSFLNV